MPGSEAYLCAWSAPRRPPPTTAARSSGMAIECDVERARAFERTFAFKHQSLVRFDADKRRAKLAQQLDRRGPDRGAVDAQALAGVCRLRDHQPAANERGSPAQRRVRP